VGTFVQPQLVFSSQGMKQLVFDPESVILSDGGLKMTHTNGFINGAIVTTTTPTLTPVVTNAQATITTTNNNNNNINNVSNGLTAEVIVNEDVKPTPEELLLGNHENYVTLHIPEDESMVTNELDAFNQNEEISKLFKQVRKVKVAPLVFLLRTKIKNSFNIICGVPA
jgi:hypothetical protein